MKRGLIVLLILMMFLVPVSFAEEYYLPGEQPQTTVTTATATPDTKDTYVPPTPAEEKTIVRQNYYDIQDLQKEALNFCRKKEHDSAVEKLDSAFELADELAYINQGFNRLEDLAKVWILCASYQEGEERTPYILGAGRAVEAGMVKADMYIEAQKIRASQMFLILAGEGEKMRYQARDLETKYNQQFTCEMELYCLEKSKELEHPQAEETINKLASSGECEGFSAKAPEEQPREKEKQELIDELIQPQEVQQPQPTEEMPGPPTTFVEPEQEAEEQVQDTTGQAKTLSLLLIISILSVIVIISVILILAKRKHK
ncbi:hypothetical protein KY326_00465 [Candidatus Woesearchaeota archaeon]|nr:hypothetical protein [Candidatus Woesearchaeota archaeon]